jgi:hypothetical protein
VERSSWEVNTERSTQNASLTTKVFLNFGDIKITRNAIFSTTYGVRSPAKAKDFSSSLCVQTSSGAHPASCTMGTVGHFLGGKARSGPDAGHSSPSSGEVRNEQELYLLFPLAPTWCSGTALISICYEELTEQPLQQILTIHTTSEDSTHRLQCALCDFAGCFWVNVGTVCLILCSVIPRFVCYFNKLYFRNHLRKEVQLGKDEEVILGGLVVIVLAIRPKVGGFKPGWGRWIFKGDKNP